MALPNARKIVVNGMQYEYLIKNHAGDRYGLKWTPKNIRLTIKSTEAGSKARQYVCNSKHWKSEHSEIALEGLRCGLMAKDHKVALTPKDIANIITNGNMISPMETDNWKIEPIRKDD